MVPRRHYTFQLESMSEIDFSRFVTDLFDLSNSNEFSESTLKLMSDWHQTLRNVTETTRHPFDARIEEMKQNSQNMFGCFKEM